MNRKEIIQTVHKLDPSLKENDVGFKAAMLLLAALDTGPDAEKAAKKAGVPLSLAREFAKRLIENGVWKDGKTVCDWFDENNGGIAFWMDVSVALGFVQRSYLK